MLTREVNQVLGLPQQHIFLDLAVLLPSVYPGTDNDSLDDWAAHCGIRPLARHRAIADAYTNAQLMLLVLERAQRDGLTKVGELIAMERAQVAGKAALTLHRAVISLPQRGSARRRGRARFSQRK